VPSLSGYAELFCLPNFTFLHGASRAEELVAFAVQLGDAALALTDECSLAGVVRAHAEAKKAALPLLIGPHFHLKNTDGSAALSLLLLAQNRNGYGIRAPSRRAGRRGDPLPAQERLRHRHRAPAARHRQGRAVLTLEDETGNINVIVWPSLARQQRREVLQAPLLGMYGVWQREGEVRHLVAKRLVDMSALLGRIGARSRDFC